MSRAVIVRELGGPEVLKLEERPALVPGPGQVVVRNEAIGLFVASGSRQDAAQVPNVRQSPQFPALFAIHGKRKLGK